MVYYWPSLLDNKTMIKADRDVMIFSLSKLSGHAATRFGWALVKDDKVAKLMATFIARIMIHTSIDAQFRALRIIQHIAEHHQVFFDYIRSRLQTRWKRLLDVFHEKDPHQERYAVESVPGLFYVWLHCKQYTKQNCYELLKKNNIMAWQGEDFGIPQVGKYVRMEMVLRDSTFELLLKRLRVIL
jgi:L-tryptophan--pyruvate aminotransferase